MKILCIGRNYVEHIKELGNQVPDEPVIFLKPATALLPADQAFSIPPFTQNLHYECELVVKIGRGGRRISVTDAAAHYEEISLGVDFTARDVQDGLKKKGLPWEKAKAFDGSAAVGSWVPAAKYGPIQALQFHLTKNGETVQVGETNCMMHSVDQIISHVSEYFSLEAGDLIFTGTPAGVGACQPGDLLQGYLGDEKLLHVAIAGA